MTGDIGFSAAVMSWGDPEYLNIMQNRYTGHDIEAGFVVYHKFPIEEEADDHCYLHWLPKEYCELMSTLQAQGDGEIHYNSPRQALGDSKLQWMAENTAVSKVC